MANSIVKIYELKTIGYDEVAGQLQNVNNLFEQIRQTKIKLNNTKLSTDDKKTIDDTIRAINEEKIRTKELQLQKQQLKNEALALNNIRQQEINKSKEAALQVKAEAGSYVDLINRQKELFNLLKNSNQGGAPGSTIDFRGQKLGLEEARRLYQQLGVDAKNQLNFVKGINEEFGKVPAKIIPIQDAGQRMTSAINNGLTSLKGNLSQVIFMYTGWFAAFREVGSLIAENRTLSDTFADLQIRIHGTRDDVEKLVEQLRQINTRTSLQGLTEIAAIVAKKGVPREELAGLTKEFDKLNVVLGKELGEPDTAVANIIKLITVFNDDRHVTAQRVNEIASSMFKLTTSGVATGEFLTNFAERVGAVRGITGITLPNVLALGAAMQQLGQRVELSSTALIQLVTRIFADVPKYAAAAGKSVQDFRKTLEDNPFEGLVQVAEGLKNLNPEELGLKFEEIVQAFQEVGVTGVRIKAVLGDIATNADFVRERMRTAAVSTEDYAKMNEAAALKQNTFAATLDKVRKSLELIGTNTTVQAVLAAIASAILLLTSHIGLIIGLLATYAGTWVIANSAMIAARVATVASNVAFTAQYAILVISNTFMQAYTATVGLFTGSITRATAATTLFRSALSLAGIGLIITAIALLAGAFTTLNARITNSISSLKEHTQQQLIQQEITNKATESIREQMATLNTYANVVLSASASLDTKKKAMEELVKMNDKFKEAINGDIIDLEKFKKILQETRDEILLNAQAMASQELTKEKFQDILTAQSLRQRIERTGAQGGSQTIKLSDLTDAEKKLIQALAPQAPRNSLDYDFFFNMTGIIVDQKNLKKWQDLFKGIEKQMTDVYDQYQVASVDLQNKVNQQNNENQAKLDAAARQSLDDRIKAAQSTQVTGKELEDLIKDINAQIPKYKEGDAKVKELANARDSFQKRLDEFRLKKATNRRYSGARLSGEDRDQLNEIEAARRIELANAEADFSELQADHRATYEEEIDHSTKIRDINLKFLDQKIKYLNGLGTLNAKELEQMATFRKEKADETLKYQREVQGILDSQYNLEARNLKGTLTNNINDIQTRNAGIQGDASLTNEQRAQAKLDSDRQILALQETFNTQMDALEKKFNQKTRENADEGAKTRQQIMQDTIDILNAQIKDAGDAADKLDDEFKTRAAEKTIQILQSGKSNAAIARELKKLNDDLARDLLASDVARLKIELDLYEKGKDGKIKSEKEYQDALRKYKEAEAKLVEVTQQKELTGLEKFKKAIKDFIGGLGENVLGIKKYTDDVEGEAEKQHDAYDQAYRAIDNAISEAERGYFDSLNAQAEREHDVQTERLNAEKEQVQARAQSQAEKDSIDKQYAAKQKALDKAESERKKSIALKQISIDFAVAVIKAIAQYGLPLALIPIAAETALYFVQRANIQKQTFARGGWLKDGGEIEGPSHAGGGVKFSYNEAEGKELAIINKKSAISGVNYQVSGTPKQIASAINWIGGGTNFAPGGTIFRKWADGGILGSSYTAPVYTPSNQVSADFSSYHNDIVDMAKAISERIDNIEVVLDTTKVTKEQKQTKLKNEIGTL